MKQNQNATMLQETMESIFETLCTLRDAGEPISLKLWPPKWTTIIMPDDNRMEINGGGNGTFEGVSEAFYDRMVNIFSNTQY
jgi:hypothetical protein